MIGGSGPPFYKSRKPTFEASQYKVPCKQEEKFCLQIRYSSLLLFSLHETKIPNYMLFSVKLYFLHWFQCFAFEIFYNEEKYKKLYVLLIQGRGTKIKQK